MSIFPSTKGARRYVKRATNGAHDLVDQTADRVAPALDRVQDSLDQARDLLNERAEQFADVQEYTVATVRAHPLVALGAALAFGLLIGKLIDR
jgi:ElaB/YqjD/DUF883 family membrane-anchored ribosome-binding protein